MLLRHRSGVPREIDAKFIKPLPHERQHSHPFREDQHLAVGFGQQILKNTFEFIELRAVPDLFVEDIGGVACHSHAGQKQLQTLELRLRERALLGLGGNPAGQLRIVVIAGKLLIGHADEVVVDRSPGEIILDIRLAAPEHHRAQTVLEMVEVAVSDRPPPVVQAVVLSVEPEQGAKNVRIQELDNGVYLINPVFDGRAGEHECKSAPQLLDRTGCLGPPVLDSLRLIKNHDVRPEKLLDVVAIGQDLFVVGDGEEFRVPVLLQPLLTNSVDGAEGKAGGRFYLLRPFRLQ